MHWLAVSSKLIRFVLHFPHKCVYHTHIKRLIKEVVRRSVISSIVYFLFFCKIHNILLVIIRIFLFYSFDHHCDYQVLIFHCIFCFETSYVLLMLLLCSARMLKLKISGDATSPITYIGTLGAICRCCPRAMVFIVMLVLLTFTNQVIHNIRGLTALLETFFVVYKYLLYVILK